MPLSTPSPPWSSLLSPSPAVTSPHHHQPGLSLPHIPVHFRVSSQEPLGLQWQKGRMGQEETGVQREAWLKSGFPLSKQGNCLGEREDFLNDCELPFLSQEVA